MVLILKYYKSIKNNFLIQEIHQLIVLQMDGQHKQEYQV